MKQPWYKKLAAYLERKGRVRYIMDREGKSVYLIRYYLLFKDRPRWFPFNIFLHHTLRSDEDKHPHDHPWPWASYILEGGYYEETPEGTWGRWKGSFRIRPATAFHRLVLPYWCDPARDGFREETWSLFITGKRCKEWGFLTEDGEWEPWETYLAKRAPEQKALNTMGNAA